MAKLAKSSSMEIYVNIWHHNILIRKVIKQVYQFINKYKKFKYTLSLNSINGLGQVKRDTMPWLLKFM